MTENKKINLYPMCFLVEGYSRQLIQDVATGGYYFIPPLLYDILSNYKGKTIEEIFTLIPSDQRNYLSSYFVFLKENNLACFSKNNIPFKELSLQFDYPMIISNSIILIKENETKFIEELFDRIEDLGCEHIQLFLYKSINYAKLISMLHMLENSIISSVDIVMPYCNENSIKKNKDLLFNKTRLQNLLIYNSPFTNNVKIRKYSSKRIIYVKDNLLYSNDCGIVHPLHFQNNLTFFTESKSHNTCLNRKLCIDAEGNIKNCPVMERSFGNIKNTTLQEAIEKSEFKDLWFIHKDQIDVCRDCEFRHMCTDCRCFIKDPENIYSQPAKCIYNPYICRWEGQAGYVPVEECGNYGRETGFVPNHEKIKELNKQIWGDDE